MCKVGRIAFCLRPDNKAIIDYEELEFHVWKMLYVLCWLLFSSLSSVISLDLSSFQVYILLLTLSFVAQNIRTQKLLLRKFPYCNREEGNNVSVLAKDFKRNMHSYTITYNSTLLLTRTGGGDPKSVPCIGGLS